ncbi:hypothetical protein NL108_013655 [Boleophthalmus pectinirostris]|uniref:interferon-stimulated 20 kDa exonuclease-like 2 n=1 Tax=Boleophthalmus pectinirostris TaxID=150288 RepID=UPI000A1C64C7|nr:interferon-stimulated 20 kDa exonuclease-like 2 [Boleophthalmus pectinirostris]XP_020792075.1 interferon-stimulated 20 kDa exonuclease-like 2 [Boleophthalmus pectinirostris]KAJ0066488.1 hypothetical protein NL108_013655 [Boleophthalmus pectinirostris]
MSDNNTRVKKKQWKSRWRKMRQGNIQNSFNRTNNAHNRDNTHNIHNTNTPHCNETSFTENHGTTVTVRIHSGVSSGQSSSQTSAPVRSQVTTSSIPQQHCKPTASAHHQPSSSAGVGPPKGQQETPVDFKRVLSGAVAGPSKQSSGQRVVQCFSSVAAPSKCLAIDCEMVGAGPKGQISQLARCSIVSYDGDVVYDKFIRPPLPITDYRTRWSGIRRSDLYEAMPYDQARKEILKLITGKVLIGHAIHNDLKVLNYVHPKAQIRDTSRIPLLNAKAGFPVQQPASLKRLTKAIFNRDIQTGKKGHSSVEDAKATMDLYKVVEVEWEHKLATTTLKNGTENK